MTHPVVRWQIISPNPDATTGFYKQLFGWSSSKDNALGYREVSTGPGSIDGVSPAPPACRHSCSSSWPCRSWSATSRATELGANVLVPESVLPDGDSMAVLQDPSGLSFAVCTLKPVAEPATA
jgi:predicted enzyme related to lactoylglutathione lyase